MKLRDYLIAITSSFMVAGVMLCPLIYSNSADFKVVLGALFLLVGFGWTAKLSKYLEEKGFKE
jgi:hypothetical protein